MIPSDPKTKLNRIDTAEALTESGHPITSSTLATFASRDIGPAYEVFGGRALYTWGSTLAWAKSRVRPGGRRIPDQQPQHAA